MATILGILNQIIDRRLNTHKYYSRRAWVKSVDKAKRTCVVEDSKEIEHEDVPLQSYGSCPSGLVQIPSVGSQVYITFTTDDNCFISSFSKVDEIIIDTDKVTFNGGADGMVKLQAIYDAINRLETLYNSHTHATAAVGTPCAPLPLITNLTIKDSLEDTKILH